MEFISISKAELYFSSRHISDVLKGKRNMVKGYTFKYKGGDQPPMDLNLRITEKQDLFIHSAAFETLFGGAAGGG